jgi:hypothetical protein
MPSFLAEALPLAFNPPLEFLPAFVCHVGDFAITFFFLPFERMVEAFFQL